MSFYYDRVSAHRYYLFTSLGLAAGAGTLIGLAMLASLTGYLHSGAPLRLLLLHGQLQVFGFIVLFTIGVAILLLTSSLGRNLNSPGAALAALALFLSGTFATGLGWPKFGAPLWAGGGAILGLELGRTFLDSPPKSRRRLPFDAVQRRLLFGGVVWLAVAVIFSTFDRLASLDIALWGFAGLFVFGVGLRFQPTMLGGRRGAQRTAQLGGICWSLGLVLRLSPLAAYWLPFTALGALLLLVALKPFRRPERAAAGGPWLRVYLRIAYGWLPVALLLQGLVEYGRPEYASTARHAYAAGFLLTMIMGMGQRMLPAYECRRLSSDRAPWLLLLFVTLGGLLRVSGELAGWTFGQALGGLLQGGAVLGFVALLLHTLVSPKLQPPELAAPNAREGARDRSSSPPSLDGDQGIRRGGSGSMVTASAHST